MEKESFTFQIARTINTIVVLGILYLSGSFLFRVFSGKLEREYWIIEFVFTMFVCWIAYLGSFIVPTRIKIDENFLYLYFYKKIIKIRWGEILEFRQLKKSFPAAFFKGEYYLSSKKLGFPNKLNAIFMLKRIPLVFIPKESIDHQRLIEYINGRLNHSEDDFF